MSCCSHEAHKHEEAERGQEFSLYTKIDYQTLDCLNEVTEGSGALVFKPWDKRQDQTQFVESDADEELLFNFSFNGSVKLKGIVVIGMGGESDPAHLKVFKNAVPLTFDDASKTADQEFDLQHDRDGSLEYQTMVARFNNCDSLSLYFDKNFGDDVTKICYIGLKGDFSQAEKRGVVICNYESAPQLKDHKTGTKDFSSHGIS